MLKPTLKDIADRANVSATTVSRVISGKADKYRISKKTQSAIHRLAKELNYEPDMLARSLRLKHTFSIGVVVPDISNLFFSGIARYIEIESRNAGYSVIICDSQEDTELEKESIKVLSQRKVDGMIICPVGKDSAHIQEYAGLDIPIITVDRYFPNLNLSYVVSDNYNGSIQAVNHFVENGHSKISFIQGLRDSSVNKERVKGFRDAYMKHGLHLNESYIVGENFGEQNGYDGASLLLNEPERPTAVFAGSNLIALGAIRAITEKGLTIPDDISLIAFDDQPYFDFLTPPLTSVEQKKEELGKISIRLLLDELNEASLPNKKRIVVPTELIVRRSVKKVS